MKFTDREVSTAEMEFIKGRDIMLDGDYSLLEEALQIVSRNARNNVLDALYCDLHNKRGVLTGNTAEKDVAWLAARMYADHTGGALADIDRLPADARGMWMTFARSAISALPYLMDRIASRCKVQAEALRSLGHALHVWNPEGR